MAFKKIINDPYKVVDEMVEVLQIKPDLIKYKYDTNIIYEMTFKDKSDLYLRLKRLLDSRYMGDLFKVIFAYKSKKKFFLGFK